MCSAVADDPRSPAAAPAGAARTVTLIFRAHWVNRVVLHHCALGYYAIDDGTEIAVPFATATTLRLSPQDTTLRTWIRYRSLSPALSVREYDLHKVADGDTLLVTNGPWNHSPFEVRRHVAGGTDTARD